ncbi:CLUMA_CG004973, isoform A [Clunio marinus]|uniref:CLUMA_CG004973, isoform A n=1 Tax=Clunio marinus TaxID=568069 RepID=A0A1J1HTA8_9DIPT|nr:CLUMA_CG004973, isoform A [Clunio marinus]
MCKSILDPDFRLLIDTKNKNETDVCECELKCFRDDTIYGSMTLKNQQITVLSELIGLLAFKFMLKIA